MNASDGERLRAHVAQLEFELQTAKTLLRQTEAQSAPNSHVDEPTGGSGGHYFSAPVSLPLGPSIHNLMLLADSALPLGSFAYSSGLESFLAHHKPLPEGTTIVSLFEKFLKLSIQSVAHTNVPYVLAAFRDPLSLMDLDNDLDASTPCTVARRASIAQGRALLSIWEKAFTKTARQQFSENGLEAATCIDTFSGDLKVAALSQDTITVNGHLAPIWGGVCLALGLNLEEAGYLFLLNHAKAVLSAAVRASVMGPYMSNSILASELLQDLVKKSLEAIWFLQPEDAGQVVPSLDLWFGRHELLYSRIFNS
jgi:urease accessory protein